jgi:hypothetical protein
MVQLAWRWTMTKYSEQSVQGIWIDFWDFQSSFWDADSNGS